MPSNSWLFAITTALAVAATAPSAVWAQAADSVTAIRDLPRPGYEPRTVRLGALVLAPEIAAEAHYDSNIFATSRDADDDIVINITPRVDATLSTDRLKLAADAYANLRRHAENGTENSTTFGAGGTVDLALSERHQLTGGLRFDRSVQSRADPESFTGRNESPAPIDTASADLGYRFRGGRIGFSLNAGAQVIDFRPVSESDRDLSAFRGAARVFFSVSPRFDAFFEGFVNRRDVRLAVDRSGIDRDATTVGGLIGTSLALARRWRGEIAFGVFKSNPDDVTLTSFSGLSASGRLTWSPAVRTAVTFDVFSGDVATVRAGATGRIDTRLGVRIDQEARHNLLLNLTAGFRDTRYRGIDRQQQVASIGIGGELLLNRRLSLTANASFARRSASVPLDEFERATAGIGLRLRY